MCDELSEDKNKHEVAEWVSTLDKSCLTEQLIAVLGVQVPLGTIPIQQPLQSIPQLIKRLGCEPSSLCD